MVSFKIDDGVDPLQPASNIEQLAALLSLLCGQEIYCEKLCHEAKDAIEAFLERVKEEREANVPISYEELNELLLLFNQYRVERPFFDFFFLSKDPRLKQVSGEDEGLFITFKELKGGVKRFRGFAMLCFGNFRFAFRKLSKEKNPARFMKFLDPWNCNSNKEKMEIEKRQGPLTPVTGTQDEIERNKTWFLGYLSIDVLYSDGQTLERITETSNGDRQVQEPKDIRDRLCKELEQYNSELEKARAKGRRNTVKYLTWDFLDVYVATSMRQPWEFEETHDFAKKVFKDELDIRKIRWFDPTQSFCDNNIDKGLLEGLMLKRAKCTIYLAQEGDTLGKDSELACTLAQGKPVIAYVREIGSKDLSDCEKKLKNRPLRFFRQRLLSLLADGFFDKPDNRSEVSKAAKQLGLNVSSDQLKSEVDKVVKRFGDFEDKCRFQLIGKEEDDFRRGHGDDIERASKLLAAVESRAADGRADTIKNKHPLGMQVHLESGVANGVLVARTEKKCASLVKGILLRDLKFDINFLRNPRTQEVLATVLIEKETQSRFRVVTKDDCLTNSFWNFYL